MERSIVKSLEELKKICLNDYQDFYISLANGIARSSKEIMYNEEENTFSVFSGINGEFYEYCETQLFAHTNIIQAIEAGTLIHEKY
tara:strand:+ start:366 stop:623 length:258 start_codon:yes stop_codon:yes gene_type:complete